VAADEIDDALAPYAGVDRSATGRPWVMANMVGGLDGSAAIRGRVGALSGGADAELFGRMRALADVVLVGAETVRRERYGPVRLPEPDRAARAAAGRPPVPRVAIVSRSLDLDPTLPLLAAADERHRPMVITTADADPARVDRLAPLADVVAAGEHRVDIPGTLGHLDAQGHQVVLCEGGPTLLGEVVDADLLDELCLTLSPVMGGDPLPISTTPAGGRLARFRLAHAATSDDVLFLRYERGTDGA
jgi:riboflavin biosynthesis pyrimidine reductase